MKARVYKNISSAYLKIIFAIALVATIGFSVVSHYGITWDEPMELEMVQWNLDFIKSGKQISEHSRYHGFIFNYFSDVIYRTQFDIRQKLSSQPLPEEIQQSDWKKWLTSIREKTRVKHVITFAFSLLAYLAVTGIVSVFTGIEFAWLGVMILALFPRFWGHSFFNPKDIPFATLFTLSTCAGAFLLDAYFKAEKQGNIKIGLNQVTFYSILYGVLTGLTTGVRIGGFFLLFFLPIAHLLAQFDLKNIFKIIARYYRFYLVIFLTWTITTITIYPASWRNPIVWFWQAVHFLSKFSAWNNYILFNGKEILGSELPWYYLPRWVSISVPVLFQISALVGLIWLMHKFKKLSQTQRACSILVILQIFCLPLLAIVRQSTMYDEMRHFLFILPGIAVLSSVAIIWIYQKIRNRSVRIFVATVFALYCLSIATDMIALHPYQYTYFNRTYGGLKAAYHQQETEYWGLSFKEAMEWLNQNAKPNSTILIAGPAFAAQAFIDPNLNFKTFDRDEFPWGKVPNPDYYMALPRYDYQTTKFFPECPIVYAVTRQETQLTTIRKCSNQKANKKI